jgi:hypothetical protein
VDSGVDAPAPVKPVFPTILHAGYGCQQALVLSAVRSAPFFKPSGKGNFKVLGLPAPVNGVFPAVKLHISGNAQNFPDRLLDGCCILILPAHGGGLADKDIKHD